MARGRSKELEARFTVEVKLGVELLGGWEIKLADPPPPASPVCERCHHRHKPRARFTPRNPFDLVVAHDRSPWLSAVELKAEPTALWSFGELKEHQEEGLLDLEDRMPQRGRGWVFINWRGETHNRKWHAALGGDGPVKLQEAWAFRVRDLVELREALEAEGVRSLDVLTARNHGLKLSRLKERRDGRSTTFWDLTEIIIGGGRVHGND